MAKSAAVPQFAVFADIDLEALDRVREGLGVHFLQALVTTALMTRPETLLQAPAHPDETGRRDPSKSLCHGAGVGCSAPSVYSYLW
jgi:hypothetical protein